jgi:hypothetical protein
VSRRIAAPLLLLVAAALSFAAVFAVHDIEATGGPVGQPSVQPPYFSPNGDGVQDTVAIGFTTKRPEHMTIRIRRVGDEAGLVRTLVKNEVVDGPKTFHWDGTNDQGKRVLDGAYVALITRRGDSRVYAPVNKIEVDTAKPRARLDRATFADGQLRGVALLQPDGTKIVVTDAEGEAFHGFRTFTPRNPSAESATPHGRVPVGTGVKRFVGGVDDIDPDDLHIYAQDLAGNRTDLLAGNPDALEIEVPL